MKKFYSLAIALAASFSFAQTNLVQNPGFEDGEMGAWVRGWTNSYTEPTLVENSSNAHSGDWYAQYVATATTGFYQKVPVTPAASYTLSFWYKASGTGNGPRLWSPFLANMNTTTSIWLQEDPANDPLRTNNGHLAMSDTWTQVTVPFTTPSNATVLQLHVRAYNNSTVAFDDFEITGNLAVADYSDFSKAVKMNTVVTDKLVLTLPVKSAVNLYTIDGKLISSNLVANGGSVDTSSLAKGVYLVEVNNGKTKFSQKIVKK